MHNLLSFLFFLSTSFTFISRMNSSMASSSPGNCFFRLAAISVFPEWMWYSLRVRGTQLESATQTAIKLKFKSFKLGKYQLTDQCTNTFIVSRAT